MIKTNGVMNWVLSGVSLVMIGYHLILAPDTEYSTKSMIFWCMLHLIADIRLSLGKISITAMVMPHVASAESNFKDTLEKLIQKSREEKERLQREKEEKGEK